MSEGVPQAQRRGRLAYLGKTFGRLNVVEYQPARANHHPKLVCQCSCGNVVTVVSTSLTRGATKSCGCLNAESRVINNTKHGDAYAGEYHVWKSMIQRCTNQSHVAYGNYGGRGIRVCAAWMRYKGFIADMGRRPSASHTLDRFPNQNGNYEPRNCRWATFTEQARNRRSNRLLTFREQTKTVTEWAEEFGLNFSTITRRLDLYGYSVEEALTKPLYWRGR